MSATTAMAMKAAPMMATTTRGGVRGGCRTMGAGCSSISRGSVDVRVALMAGGNRSRSSRTQQRGGSVRVHAMGWLLKNTGPKTCDHLDVEVDIPGDLPLAGPLHSLFFQLNFS